MKNRIITAILTAGACIMIVTGCASGADKTGSSSEKSAAEQTSESTASGKASESGSSEDVSFGKKPAEIGSEAASESSEADTETAADESGASVRITSGAHEFTADEIAEWNDYFEDIGNNGFMAAQYSDIRQIDLDQVFHNGAGINEVRSQQDIDDYLAFSGNEELMTDLIVLKKSKVDAFLKKKTGMTYDDFLAAGNQGFFEYDEATDKFYAEVGDTSYCPFKVTSGRLSEDNMITLEYETNPEYNYNDYTTTGVMRMKLVNGSPLFVSNAQMNTDTSENDGADDSDTHNPAYDVESYTTDADVSGISSFSSRTDYSKITKEALYGIWYCPDENITLDLRKDGANVYFPTLQLSGYDVFDWTVEDRTSRGKCPKLSINVDYPDQYNLVFYISGVRDDVMWSNTTQEIFYKQK